MRLLKGKIFRWRLEQYSSTFLPWVSQNKRFSDFATIRILLNFQRHYQHKLEASWNQTDLITNREIKQFILITEKPELRVCNEDLKRNQANNKLISTFVWEHFRLFTKDKQLHCFQESPIFHRIVNVAELLCHRLKDFCHIRFGFLGKGNQSCRQAVGSWCENVEDAQIL